MLCIFFCFFIFYKKNKYKNDLDYRISICNNSLPAKKSTAFFPEGIVNLGYYIENYMIFSTVQYLGHSN